MKVLVTGANGYIGQHVVTALLNRHHQVLACDRNFSFVDQRAEQISEDIFSGAPDIYQRLGTPDTLIHMAWMDGFVHNSLSHLQYLPFHYRFLQDMLEGGLQQIAVMGTMHEIGYWEGVITENTPTNPLSLYGIAKNALRQSLNILQEKYPDSVMQWLRAYYIYGDEAKSHSIFSKIIIADKNGEKTFPFTSGKNCYDFIEVNDLADQISCCATQQDVKGIINCCSGKPVSLGDAVERFIRKKGLNIKLEYGAFPDRAYDSSAVWGDTEKICRIMGYPQGVLPVKHLLA